MTGTARKKKEETEKKGRRVGGKRAGDGRHLFVACFLPLFFLFFLNLVYAFFAPCFRAHTGLPLLSPRQRTDTLRASRPADDAHAARMDAAPALPPEIWDHIMAMCDRRATAVLGGACSVLRALAMRRVAAVWSAARAAMDDAVDRWERTTAPWDVLWTDPLVAWCDACGRTEQRRARQWICDDGLPGDARARNVCDACMSRAMAGVDRGAWPARRVELARPHVWSVDHYGGVVDALSSEPVQRFVVPSAAVHLVDPLAPSTIARWTRHKHVEVLFRSGLAPARLPSVRAWLPLAGAQHVVLCDDAAVRYDVMRLALVCCDAGSAMWGAVLLVDHTMSERTAVWALAGESVDSLLRRYRDRAAVDEPLGLVAWLYRSVTRG